MAIKKSELYGSLWRSCDELRGGMDASQYKDYVLILLFVKYVSDKFKADPFAVIEIPEGGGFDDLVALKGQSDIGDRMNKVIKKLMETNDLSISFADFNDVDKIGKGREMIDRLSKLISIFENPALDFSRNRAEGDDILGDAYEFLMRHFATESGKSKGQFYTPAEVSRIMSKVIGITFETSQDQTIYDPTCGSGSLLIKAADEAERGLSIYGQEMDNSTASLAKMNMILHNHPTARIEQDNTLAAPRFKGEGETLKTFDFAVANPPFSTKAWTSGIDPHTDPYKRFEDGIPPAKNGDYAFLQHIVRSLKSKGKGAIILPHGVLFRGNAEAVIRRNIIRRGLIKGIIALPANLFYGTGIPACIIVVDKENAQNRQGIFMIDAGGGFVKDGNKNRLRHQDIHKIVDVFNNQTEIPAYSRMVGTAEIEANDYNLNIPRYIDSQVAEDQHDITAHLQGGVPAPDVEGLDDYWQVCPGLESELFEHHQPMRNGYYNLKIEPSDIKHLIYHHPEFVAYKDRADAIFAGWRSRNTPILKGIEVGAKPKDLIYQISEDILSAFGNVPLVEKYDVYQHLMSYWSDVMQDDVYMIATGGWFADFDLIPSYLVVNRYFARERDHIEQLEADKEAIGREREELEEEHGGEEGIIENLKNDKGKISRPAAQERVLELRDEILEGAQFSFEQKRLAKQIKKEFFKLDWQKGIRDEAEIFSELDVLHDYLSLVEAEAAALKKVREARLALDRKVLAKCRELSVEEIKTLVVDDKWMAALDAAVKSELERVAQNLTGRIKTLATRYAAPLPELTAEVDKLSAKVDAHLAKMGFASNSSAQASGFNG